MARTFYVSDAEEANAKAWMEKHNSECRFKGKYTGAVGHGWLWSFYSNTIGGYTILECGACQESEIVTPEDEWW